MSDNKCMTCAHGENWRTGSDETCSTCVGFRRWEAVAVVKQIPVEFTHGVGDFDVSEKLLARPANTMKPSSTWLKFVPVALAIAQMSKDPSTKVAAIALDDNRNIVASGYNGFPRGVKDLPERYNDRPTKYKLISHAEQNLVAQAAYSGTSLNGCTVILTALYPCSACAKSLIQAGVIRIIAPPPDTDPKWAEESKWAALIFQEAGVEVWHYLPSTL